MSAADTKGALHTSCLSQVDLIHLLQSLEVHVLEGPQAQVRTVKVCIDVSQKQGKAYKGGYRDKRNGTLYHHADCQTDKQVGSAQL